MAPPQHPIGLVPHDAAQPGGKGRRLGELRQCRPGGEKCLLDDVLGLLQIVDQGQRRAEGKVLIAVGQFYEGFDIARLGAVAERFEIHLRFLCTIKVPKNAVSLYPGAKNFAPSVVPACVRAGSRCQR